MNEDTATICGSSGADDLAKIERARITHELVGRSHLLTQQNVLNVLESGAWEGMTFQEILERVNIFRQQLGEHRFVHVLRRDPKALRLPAENLRKCLNLFVRSSYGEQDAKNILTGCLWILAMPFDEFAQKLQIASVLIPEMNTRRNFLLTHPEYFLVPLWATDWKGPLKGILDFDQMMEHILLNRSGIPVALEYQATSRSATSVQFQSKAGFHPRRDRQLMTKERKREEAGNPDRDCRLPATEPKLSRRPSENNHPVARLVIQFLCHPKRKIKRHADAIVSFVRYRPWLTNADNEPLQTLVALYQLGLEDEALWDALTLHAATLALGWPKLQHVLNFLLTHRQAGLPRDLDDLPVERETFARRVETLGRAGVAFGDPIYKIALFTRTPRLFETALQSLAA